MIARLRSLLARLRHRPAPARCLVLPPFHPIIFANGRDDDTEGLRAFWEGRPVVFAGREIREPDARLSGLMLRCHCSRFEVRDDAERVLATIGFTQGSSVTVRYRAGVNRVLTHSSICFNAPVQP